MSDFDDLLKGIFEKLEGRLAQINEERRESGGLTLAPVEIKIVGQAGLLLAELPFVIAATMDLDALIDGDFVARKELGDLLLEEGIRLESDDHLIWMPPETEYLPWFDGECIKTLVAGPVAIIASKAKFQRPKDMKLLQTYLESFPQAAERIKQWRINIDWIKQ